MGEIRFATRADAGELLEIYSYYVTKTNFTLQIALPTVYEFADLIESTGSKFPYLVYVDNDEILGYAYAHDVRPREGFRFTAETSIYVKHGLQKGGIGAALYGKLFTLLKKQNIIKLYAVLCTPNEPSRLFHLRQGFFEVATFQKIGYKFDQWFDVLHMEKQINEQPDTPLPPLTIKQLDPQFVKEVLQG